MNVDGKAELTSTPSEAQRVVARVRQLLQGLESVDHVKVRGQAQHVLIEHACSSEALHEPVARLTALGREAFGLSFFSEGRWEPMVLVDSLDEVVGTLSAVLGCSVAGDARPRAAFAARAT